VVADVIRPAIVERFGEAGAQEVRVLYGGSVKGDNAAVFFGQADIDGALVGGASLKSVEFVNIVQAAVK
jgi:triosephosphate isomerase